MATSSIFKTVRIRNKSDAKNLVTALERAKGKSAKEVHSSKMHREVKGEDIVKMFEEK